MNGGLMRIGSSESRRGERGATMVLFTMMIALVIIPMVGLAIDGSVAFWARAKLSAAVDAAALAAGRSVNVKQTTNQNSGPVVSVAQQWFYANFPTGWIGTTVLNGGPNVQYITTPDSRQQVTVTASASVPMYFMRIAGYNSITVSATAQSSRRSSFVILVLDRSGSMNVNAGGNACASMKQDSVTVFVKSFTEDFDTVGLVTYSTTAGPAPDYPPSLMFKSSSPSLADKINTINCTGGTNMSQGLHFAYQSILDHGLAGGLNVIVLFTDGQPNGISAAFPIRNRPQDDGDNNRFGPGNGVSYNSPYAWPKSGCAAATITGALLYLTDPIPPAVQGMTGGLYDTTHQVLPSADAQLLTPPGCWVSSYGNYVVRGDVAFIPQTDSWGNPTTGSNAFKSVDTFTAGPYVNQIRPDEQLNGIIAAATNAVDYQAQTIRNNATYNTIIYTIGLGGAPDMPIDATLLERIANDPRSPIYDPTKTPGFFAYASNLSQLNQAFTQVAGQILRLSQ